MTIQLEFTPEILAELAYERFHHPDPIVQRRMEALWLKSHGLPHAQISILTGVCANTMRDYFELYKTGGVDGLKVLNFYRPQSELKAHAESLEAYFKAHPVATIKEAQAIIEEETGIKRSETQVRNFLKKLGMSPRKIGMLPAKADPKKQAEYLEKDMTPRLDEAQAGKRAIFFMDAAHFVLAPFLGILWSFTRLFIQAPAGRQRFNVLGAINAVTHELVTVTNDTYINAESVCNLLHKLASLKLEMPISIFLDNARYQKCNLVTTTADQLNIELCFLPSYSPNLNLIERLWKFVKKNCLYSKYYSDFTKFKTAIMNCLAETNTTHKSALDTLMTLKFQTFEKAQFVPV